jgi:hypothetical protein
LPGLETQGSDRIRVDLACGKMTTRGDLVKPWGKGHMHRKKRIEVGTAKKKGIITPAAYCRLKVLIGLMARRSSTTVP